VLTLGFGGARGGERSGLAGGRGALVAHEGEGEDGVDDGQFFFLSNTLSS